MKVGETKTLTIHLKKLTPVIPSKVYVYPRIQVAPSIFPRIIEFPISEFERTFGAEHKIGDIVNLPNTPINATILNITKNVSLSLNFKIGDKVPVGYPWNVTVKAIDNMNVTVHIM